MKEEFIYVKVKNTLNNDMIKSYDYVICSKCYNKKYYSYNTNFHNDEYICTQCGYKNKIGEIK